MPNSGDDGSSKVAQSLQHFKIVEALYADAAAAHHGNHVEPLGIDFAKALA